LRSEETRQQTIPPTVTGRPDMQRIKVLYIAGWGRSGSTVLGNILAAVSGVVHVGELRLVWDRGILENRKCGCGPSFRDCVFWNSVFDEAFGGIDEAFARDMLQRRETGLRTRHMPLLLAPGGRRRLADRIASMNLMIEKLYPAIQRQTGARLIVDSSKFPSWCYQLSEHPLIDLYTVHLIRDPRAVAYSWWKRPKLENDAAGLDAERMARHHPLTSAVFWNVWNTMLQRLWRGDRKNYFLLPYERFTDSPRQCIADIYDFVKEPCESLPFHTDREARLITTHTVSGNPNRHTTGSIEVKQDCEWRDKLSRTDRTLVSLVTAPWRHRFGY
jgi:hypothetical protein